MEKLNFKSKTVLITGASSGIGEEFAKSLAKQGANLIITARSGDALQALAKELESNNTGIWVKTVALDLSELNAAQILFNRIDEMGISVDYLINNAGFGKFCEFSNESIETYQSMLMLNINALVELAYLFLPNMKKQNSGGIINIASIGAFQPLPYQAVYGASKAFVLSFSEALTGELLGTNVRVMALCPGTTQSSFMDNANADTSKMNLMPASQVVSEGLVAYAKNRMVTVSGVANYLVSLIPRLVTRKTTVKIVVNMFKEGVLNKSV